MTTITQLFTGPSRLGGGKQIVSSALSSRKQDFGRRIVKTETAFADNN